MLRFRSTQLRITQLHLSWNAPGRTSRATGWPGSKQATRRGPRSAQLGVTPVSVALGRLVEREVGRTARSSASDAEAVRVALEDAREVTVELAALIARLEPLAGAPVSGGGSR